MKDLSNLSPAHGSNRPVKRLGRGIGSGNGKTAGKGHKGQKARKSGGIAAGFEGGQTPLYRRVPKRGFSNTTFKTNYTLIHLSTLNKFADGDLVNPATLKEAGFLSRPNQKIKLLCDGNLDRKLTVEVHKASAAAKVAVEKCGGSVKEL